MKNDGNENNEVLTPELIELGARESFHPQVPAYIPKENWGLTSCAERYQCPVCKTVGKNKSELRRLRDLFTYGVSHFILEKTYNIPSKEIYDHGRRKKWAAKRGKVANPTKKKDEMELLIMARIAKFWDYGNESSVDKMIQLKAKMDGLVDDKLQVEGEIGFTWEKIVSNVIEVNVEPSDK